MADPPTIVELESDGSRYFVVATEDQRTQRTTVGLLIHMVDGRLSVQADKLGKKENGEGWAPAGHSWKIGSQSIDPRIERGDGWENDLPTV